MKCCLCKEEIEVEPNGWKEGNNAMPLKDGRCCEGCNYTKVLPERLRRSRIISKQEKLIEVIKRTKWTKEFKHLCCRGLGIYKVGATKKNILEYIKLLTQPNFIESAYDIIIRGDQK